MRKKLRPGVIELAPDECSIVVHYESETTYMDDSGNVIRVERKPNMKRIRVKTLTERSNIEALAREVVEKCRLISESKLPIVERLLHQLRQRDFASEVEVQQQEDERQEMLMQQRRNRGRNFSIIDMENQQQPIPKFGADVFGREATRVDDLEGYLEQLYEDMPQKERGTYHISRLAAQPETLPLLLEHETLLGALSRVLREEGRKSVTLTFNILYTFFSISHFSEFHQLIIRHQIGDMTMRILDLELKRGDACFNEGIEKDIYRAERKLENGDSRSLEGGKGEKSAQALIWLRKQDNLLYVCTYLLLNIAEDIAIEKKMRKRGIVVYLTKLLERRNVDLLTLAVMFLKKLSVFRENIQKMAECKVIEKISAFLPHASDLLLVTTLRLLHNLSFGPALRDDIVKAGLVPTLIDIMKESSYQAIAMGILYHISIEDKYKSVFTYTDAIPALLDMVLNIDELHTAPELISLAVNITQNERNAEMLCNTGDGFHALCERALLGKDSLAFKLLRNLSQHQGSNVKSRFKDYVDKFILLMKSPDTSPELLVEILGTLGNLTNLDMEFEEHVRRHDLLYFLSMHLQSGLIEDDIILEITIFIGTLCDSLETAEMIVDSGLVSKLYHLMSDKKGDDEMILQIIFTFARLLQFSPTREILLRQTQVVYYLIDLIYDKNKEVRKIASVSLDTIMDHDEEWAIQIRRLKFETYNREWLEATEEPGGSDLDVHGEHHGENDSDGIINY